MRRILTSLSTAVLVAGLLGGCAQAREAAACASVAGDALRVVQRALEQVGSAPEQLTDEQVKALAATAGQELLALKAQAEAAGCSADVVEGLLREAASQVDAEGPAGDAIREALEQSAG